MSDAGVRLARADDAVAMARVQIDAWRDQYGDVLPRSLLDGLDVDAVAATWREAVVAPPSPGHRVVVAVSGGEVVGLLAWGPATDPDAEADHDVEVLALLVAPPVRAEGHGSRLLAAWADLAREGGATGAITWLPATDDLTREFLVSTGWAADGAHRELAVDDEGPRVKQIRLVTGLR